MECDWDLATEEFEAKPVLIPMTTINWLLDHFGAAPALFAELEIVGGADAPTPEGYGRMWGHTMRRGDHALAAMLNEVIHHGTQICMLRDMYAHRHGTTRQR